VLSSACPKWLTENKVVSLYICVCVRKREREREREKERERERERDRERENMIVLVLTEKGISRRSWFLFSGVEESKQTAWV
jgi:hypothetical protein